MNSKPSVTIVIPYKNNLKYLFLALKSVFQQTYKNYKVLIIYDDENYDDLDQIKKFLKLKIKEKFKSVKIKINKKEFRQDIQEI